MKLQAIFASTVSCLLLAGPLSAQIQNIPPDTQAIPPPPPPPPVIITPAEEILNEANEILNTDYRRYNLTVSYNKGILTVKGLVTSELVKHEVGTRLSNIFGVQGVDNQLIVGPSIPGYERESGAEYVPQQ